MNDRKDGFTTDWRPRGGWRAYLFLALITFLGISISLVAFVIVQGWANASVQAELERRVNSHTKSLQRGIDNALEVVYSIRGLYAASQDDEVNPAEFRAFTELALKRNPGIQALEWIPRVPERERAAYEEAVRQNGYPDFRFTELSAEGKIVAARPRKEYFPVYYIEPHQGNERAFGLDLGSNVIRLQAITRARDTGQAVASARIRLVQERGQQNGFLVIVPIYRNGLPHDTLQQRRENLVGLALGVFRIGDLVEAALESLTTPAGADIYFYDDSAEPDQRFLYFHPSRLDRQPRRPLSVEEIDAGVNWAKTIEVAGRDWRMLFKPISTTAGVQQGWQAWGVLVGGLTITMMLATYLLISLHRARKTQRLVSEISKANTALECEITERKRAEDTLKESEERFRELLEAAPDAMIIVNQHGEIVLANKHAETIFGYARETLIGSPVEILIPQDLREGHVKNRTAFAAEPKRRPMGQSAELFGVARDGRTFPVEISLSPLRTEEGLLITATVRDITEAKLAEEQLRQAQKMEAVGQLTGGVAHDFNNLLAVILGNAEIAEDRCGENDESVKAIIRAAEHGAQLTQRLLAFSRRQPLDSKPIDLGALVEDVHQLLHRTLGETIDIEIVTAPSLWNAVADSSQLETALLNLAINARDAMPDGGKLIIETTNVSLSTSDVTSHMEVAPGDYVSLSVSDTGNGMSPEIREHVFEPFFTTKEVGEGSGLGLSMVYGFAKQSGGDVTIESNPGHGTAVTLFLPRAKGAVEQPIQSDAPSMPKARGETVLLVEDEPDVRAMAETMLENLGYRVFSAENAWAGLDILKTEPAIDLLLSDVVLPGSMNGCELAAEAEQCAPGILVLYMSGYTSDATMHHGRFDAGAELLQKPFRRIDLAEAVRRALDGPSA